MTRSKSLPKLFIGSSTGGKPVAEALQRGLERDFETTIWSQGFFTLSKGFLESLCEKCKNFDFAVLVLTSDDVVASKDTTKMGPRDNVIFELGLFMGALGRDRTFIVYNRDEDIKIPTDLAGIAMASYPNRGDGNLVAALGPACAEIRDAAVEVGNRLMPSDLDLDITLVRRSPRSAIVKVVRNNKLPFDFNYLFTANGQNPGGIPIEMSRVHGDNSMTVFGNSADLGPYPFPYELKVDFKAVGVLADPMKKPPRLRIIQRWHIEEAGHRLLEERRS